MTLGELQGLPLAPYTARRRDESLELLQWLDERIRQLDDQVAEAAAVNPAAQLLLTHPGVGSVTALTTVVVLGPVCRFPAQALIWTRVISYPLGGVLSVKN